MLLTEPQAGSDVGSLTTTATRNPDGAFNITGSKIFITAGDQNLTENIIPDLVKRGLIYAKNLDIKIHHTH